MKLKILKDYVKNYVRKFDLANSYKEPNIKGGGGYLGDEIAPSHPINFPLFVPS